MNREQFIDQGLALGLTMHINCRGHLQGYIRHKRGVSLTVTYVPTIGDPHFIVKKNAGKQMWVETYNLNLKKLINDQEAEARERVAAFDRLRANAVKQST